MERLAAICTACLELVALSCVDALDSHLFVRGNWVVCSQAHGSGSVSRLIRLPLHGLPWNRRCSFFPLARGLAGDLAHDSRPISCLCVWDLSA